MKKIRNLIFDFDGTLADTSDLIVATMQKSVQDLGLPPKSRQEMKATIGVRLEEIPAILWPAIENLGKPFSDIYRKNFEITKDKIPVTLFPGVKATLERLKLENYQMAVATSRSHRSVEMLSEDLGIKDCFRCLIGGDDIKEGKPHPESVLRIMKEMNWKGEETMMVGDMPVDIIMGKNAGVSTCGVAYGNGNSKDLEEAWANFIISRFPDLIKIL